MGRISELISLYAKAKDEWRKQPECVKAAKRERQLRDALRKAVERSRGG